MPPHRRSWKPCIGHCEIIWEIAEQLLERFAGDIDGELVGAGFLLHDVGVYRVIDGAGSPDRRNYVRHGLLGHQILRSEGFPEALRRFCSCHTGVGLTRNDVIRQRLPLPVADHLAVTAEERLVMYADKFHSKTTPPTFLTADACAAHVRRFGEDEVEAFGALRERFGVPDVTALAGAHGQGVQEWRTGSDRRGPATREPDVSV